MQDRRDTRDKREARNRRDKKTCLTAFAILVMFSRLVPVVLLGDWAGQHFACNNVHCVQCTLRVHFIQYCWWDIARNWSRLRLAISSDEWVTLVLL